MTTDVWNDQFRAPPRHSGSKRRTQTSSFRAQSRNPCLPSRTHRCCDYAQHDGVCRATLPPPPPSLLTPHCLDLTPHSSLLTPPRHSGSKRRTQTSSSRGIHASHHARIDAATTRSMTACAGQRCPHPLIPHSYAHSYALTPHSTLHTPPRHSGSKRRTQTSSFRAQSRNPCLPSRTHRCCDYAQHDGVCRATLPPSFLIRTSLLTSLSTPHSSLLTPPRHSGSKRRTQTSSFRAQSRNPCLPSRTHRCCDYAQHDGVCRATLPPSPHSSLLTPTPSLLTPPRHSGSKRRTQTSSFRA